MHNNHFLRSYLFLDLIKQMYLWLSDMSNAAVYQRSYENRSEAKHICSWKVSHVEVTKNVGNVIHFKSKHG